MSLIAIKATLLGEVGGHSFFLNLWRATPWSGGNFRIDWWCSPCQVIVSMLSLFFSVAMGGVICHGFESLLLVPREPCDRRLCVESVVFPTDPPPGVQGGDDISDTGWVYAQMRDDHALRMPCSCRDIVLCA